MPAVVDGLNSQPFAVPQGAKSLTIYVPALVGVATTVKLQTLTPDQPGTSEDWRNISLFNLADGTFVLLDELVESTTVTLPVAATGGGILRLVASVAQTGAADAIIIPIFFHLGF